MNQSVGTLLLIRVTKPIHMQENLFFLIKKRLRGIV
jgi:hypothetical protein